jgi:hypothetical protein
MEGFLEDPGLLLGGIFTDIGGYYFVDSSREQLIELISSRLFIVKSNFFDCSRVK